MAESTIMNAFGAQLQNKGFENFAIFSSWLSPLQSSEVALAPGSMAANGSIEGHVRAAVRV